MIDVVISIKPKFVDLIKDGHKNYEFRKYIPISILLKGFSFNFISCVIYNAPFKYSIY